MNPHEEELQKRFEAGLNPQDQGPDARAYGKVFRALSRDPGYRLPDGFAERVIFRLQAQQRRRDARDYFWFAAGLVFLAISFAATAAYTGFRLNWGFLNAMSDYKGLLIFGGLFIAFLHWIDKRLVRPLHEERS